MFVCVYRCMYVCLSGDVCVEVRGHLAGVGSVHSVDSRIQTKVGRHGGKHLYPLDNLTSLTSVIQKACLGS